MGLTLLAGYANGVHGIVDCKILVEVSTPDPVADGAENFNGCSPHVGLLPVS
jgi:hypothetical protein